LDGPACSYGRSRLKETLNGGNSNIEEILEEKDSKKNSHLMKGDQKKKIPKLLTIMSLKKKR